MRLIDAESSLPTRPVELEDRFMRRCQIKYCDARSLLLQARSDLGMTKVEPWTEALKARVEELYEAKYGKPVPPETPVSGGDTDSTVTPGTHQSYSFDVSEDTAGTVSSTSLPHQSSSSSSSARIAAKKLGAPPTKSIDVPKEDPTEDSTEATLHEGDACVATHKKKKRGGILKRVFRLRPGGRQATV